MNTALEIKSEIAYDLLQDHFDTILGLFDQPLTRVELVARLGSDGAVERLVRHGLLAAEGERLRAVSSVYQQVRQEGMMTFLSRYVLPALTQSIEDDAGFAGLWPRFLRLSPAAMAALRQGAVQELLAGLGAVSDEPAQGPVSRMTVLCVGTSYLVREPLPDAEAALQHLRRASTQRATPADKALAVLAQGDFMADAGRYTQACALIDGFVQRLEAQRAESLTEATYHLTVAYYWRTPTASGAQNVARQ